MKVGVFSFVFQDLLPFEKALDWIAGVGAEAVEIGSGGYVAELGESYCKPKELLAAQSCLQEPQARAGWASVSWVPPIAAA